MRVPPSTGPVVMLAALLVAAAACSAGRPPLFEGSSDLSGRMLLLEPQVGLGTGVDEARARGVASRLLAELRASLAGRGVTVDGPWTGPGADAARRQLFERMRRSGGERLRAGTAVPLDDALEPLRETGASEVLAARLLRRPEASDGGFVPRRPGEIVELPDDRPDYQIPTAAEFATGGVDLELLLVDTSSWRVVTHRRVSHPVTGDDVESVLPVLARLATRGLAGPGR